MKLTKRASGHHFCGAQFQIFVHKLYDRQNNNSPRWYVGSIWENDKQIPANMFFKTIKETKERLEEWMFIRSL